MREAGHCKAGNKVLHRAKGKKGWRTYQPSVISRKRTHGFLRRMKHHSGRNTIRRRQRHGRWRVSVT